MNESWRTAPKDGASRGENLGSQPLRRHSVFNNPDVVAEAWYPACRSSELAKRQTRSVKITNQRLVVFRGEDGVARALDAFCPHMGADLGNGRVQGQEIECYFHGWCFDGGGELTKIRARCELPRHVRTRGYPVEEKYGFLWVYAGEKAPYPVPDCPGLEGKAVVSLHLGAPLLFAHHHVMMAGGVDLQHFATVHGLDMQFELSVEEREEGGQLVDFRLAGKIPNLGWRARLGRWLLGEEFRYVARFAGGSIVALSYGMGQRLFGRGRPLAPLHILWGCAAESSGVSRVQVILVAERRPGLGLLLSWGLIGLTALLLMVLRDDDVKAFPNMRFQLGRLIEPDTSVARFVQFIDKLPRSIWSRPEEGPP